MVKILVQMQIIEILLLIVYIVEMLRYVIFRKKNVQIKFLFRKIVKILVKMRIMEVLLLVVPIKVRIKVMKQSNQRYIDLIYL